MNAFTWIYRCIVKIPKSTEEKLEELHSEINELESLKSSDIDVEKKLVFRLFIYSFLFYGCSSIFIYYFYWPSNKYYRYLFYSSIVIYLAIVTSCRHIFRMFFVRRVRNKEIKLVQLRKEKKIILDQVMETETYNKAQIILTKYGSDAQLKNLKKQTSDDKKQPASKTDSPVKSNEKRLMLSRPILPRERSIMEKMIDALVGDGPNKRYALICNQCSSHNGMALAEEFSFIAFRCCYCNYLNPARKKREKVPDSPLVSSHPSSINASDEKHANTNRGNGASNVKNRQKKTEATNQEPDRDTEMEGSDQPAVETKKDI